MNRIKQETISARKTFCKENAQTHKTFNTFFSGKSHKIKANVSPF